jgi:hypothetical protein
MLGHWPALYPGETVYSGCARFAARMGVRSNRKTLIELFGTARISDPADFPCNLGHLLRSIPEAFEVTPNELIWKHTILPFFQPFFGSSLIKKMTTEMLGTFPEIYSRRLRGVSALPQYLRFARVASKMTDLLMVRLCTVQNRLTTIVGPSDRTLPDPQMEYKIVRREGGRPIVLAEREQKRSESWASIVAVRWYFHWSRVARDSVDRRSRLSHSFLL